MKENKNENYEIGEEATRYGEFITSYFAWLPLSVQKGSYGSKKRTEYV